LRNPSGAETRLRGLVEREVLNVPVIGAASLSDAIS
jgi:hypothetical protein